MSSTPHAPVEDLVPPEPESKSGTGPRVEGAPAARGGEAPWQRLSWRMLFVTPLGILTRLLPLFLISLWLGSNRDNYWFEIGVTSLVIVGSFLRWISTSYRIGETHIVLRKGFFSRNVITVSRDRIRSVDTESDLFHRLLRVSIVEVGTGEQHGSKSSDGQFRLDAIDSRDVEPLREELLKHLRELRPELEELDEEQWGSRFGEDIARWKITWARFAPFSMIGFGVLLTLWLLTWQMGDMHDRIMQLGVVVSVRDWIDSLGEPWSLFGDFIAVWAVAGVLAIITYAIRYGKYSLSDHGKSLYVQNGILRRKHIALDKARLRGVEIRLPVFLRMLGGGRLEPIMTGTKRGGQASTLLPQAPLKDVRRVATRILEDEQLVTMPLRKHGPAAARRRITRALIPWYVVMTVLVLMRVDQGSQFDVWLYSFGALSFVFFLLLGIDRLRMLGHEIRDGKLITSHGSWQAKRVVLDAEGIIGWSTSTSPLQRLGGLTTLVAATPAGNNRYSVMDIPRERAWAVAETLTPGITDVWGRSAPPRGGRHRL